MRRNVSGAIVVGMGALLLGACGGGAVDGAADDGESNVAAVSDWVASDACALLDKAAVGAALGDTVTETSLAFVTKAEGSNAATSECTYMLAGGSRATLMARRSPIADNNDAAIKQTRETTEKTMAAFSDKKIEDVAGLGKAAFFVPGINQMNVFLDDSRFVILTVGSAPDATAKDVAAGLVKKIAP